MVFSTSTNGTWLMTSGKRSGRMFVTGAHQQASCASAFDDELFRRFVIALGNQMFGAAMKSVNVFSFCFMRPASCHGLPSSPPPRMCATAKITPRFSKLSRFELKLTGIEIP